MPSGLAESTSVSCSAQVNGFAAQYEKTGDKDALIAVQHFFDVITHHHSYATGGACQYALVSILCTTSRLPLTYTDYLGYITYSL